MNRKAACLHRWRSRPRRGADRPDPPRYSDYHLADGKSAARRRRRSGTGFTHRRTSGGGFWLRRHANLVLPFGLTSEQRGAAFADHLHLIHSAWRGDTLSHPDNRLYPPAPQLAERIWIATFSAEGAIRAGQAGHGLMLSRTQPRPPGEPRLPLDAIQNPIIHAYLRGAAGRRCAADPRLAHRLRRRQSRPRPAGRRSPVCASRQLSTGRRVIR